MGYLSHLECSRCGERHEAAVPRNLCARCGSGPLMAKYHLARVAGDLKREALKTRQFDIWRYRELLPINDPRHIVSMGEGWTPLVRLERISAELGLEHVFLKDEGLCPTGTFKARGASVCVSKLKELGVKAIAMPTAGNAGSAFSCYGARAGMEVHIAMPPSAPESTKRQCCIAGATVHLIRGGLEQSTRFVADTFGGDGWFNASTFKEPWRVEGKKTMGLELFEQFDGNLPDVILCPTGGGVGLVGLWKAFEELEEIGWLAGRKPRMFSVQAEGCSRLKAALDMGKDDTEYWADVATGIPGLAVAKSLGDALCLRALRESGGGALAVSDAEILSDMKRLAMREGIFTCPEGAATVSGMRQLKANGLVDREERIVLLNTGNGLKSLEFVDARCVEE